MAGVAQEKTGRVAELLVAAIAPRHLLAGKVLGIGALGLAQVALVASVVAAATAIGFTDLPSSFVPGCGTCGAVVRARVRAVCGRFRRRRRAGYQAGGRLHRLDRR